MDRGHLKAFLCPLEFAAFHQLYRASLGTGCLGDTGNQIKHLQLVLVALGELKEDAAKEKGRFSNSTRQFQETVQVSHAPFGDVGRQ